MLTSFQFVTAQTGWGISTDQPGPSFPFLFHTTNDGRSWMPVALPIPPTITVPASTNPKLQNYGVPVAPLVFATPKLGALWVTYYRWINPGYVNWAVLYITTDGGGQWQAILWHQLPNYPLQPPATIWPLSLHWQSTATGWMLQLQDHTGSVVKTFTIP